MYVPAFYYIQSSTHDVGDGETIMVSQEYAPHSAFVDLFLDALEGEVLTDD
jgi:hypothetical protein